MTKKKQSPAERAADMTDLDDLVQLYAGVLGKYGRAVRADKLVESQPEAKEQKGAERAATKAARNIVDSLVVAGQGAMLIGGATVVVATVAAVVVSAPVTVPLLAGAAATGATIGSSIGVGGAIGAVLRTAWKGTSAEDLRDRALVAARRDPAAEGLKKTDFAADTAALFDDVHEVGKVLADRIDIELADRPTDENLKQLLVLGRETVDDQAALAGKNAPDWGTAISLAGGR